MNIARITDTITQFDSEFAPIYDAISSEEERETNEDFKTALAAKNAERNDLMITTYGLHGDLENPDPATADHWKWKFQRFLFKEKQNPGNAHTFPIVTGEIYSIHWRYGLDFKSIRVEPDIHVHEDDLTTLITHNSTAVRE